MARPERNTVDYFPHMIGDGKKMFFIEQKYGNDGYATWYKLLEKLGSTENHYLDLNDPGEVMYLASKCRVEETVLLSIISDLSKMGVFNAEFWDSKIIWCQQFVDSIEDAYKRRNNNCITFEGLRTHLLSLGKLKQSKSKHNVNINTQRIVEDIKEEKIKEEENKKNLAFPFDSENFKNTWNILCQLKYWQKKSFTALQASLKKLSGHSEPDAIKMMENAIAGEWKGLFDLKPHEKTNGKYTTDKQQSGGYDPQALIDAHNAIKNTQGQQ